MSLPPLGLSVNITDPSGVVTRWGSDAPKADDRPRNMGFSSQQMQGFESFACDLTRRLDRDYHDLNLYDNLEVIGDDGSTAWDGRLSAMPRTSDEATQAISVQAVGWMAHARDRKFVMPFVDRDVTAWQEIMIERRADLMVGAGISLGDFSYAASKGIITCPLPNQALGPLTYAGLDYVAPPGCKIARIQYRAKGAIPGGWQNAYYSGNLPSLSDGAVLAVTRDDTLRTIVLATPGRYVENFTYSLGVAATPAAGAGPIYVKTAMYGDHGLPLYVGDPAEPAGVRASDVIRYLFSRYCPLIDPSGIRATDYAIQHLVFREPTDPYDGILDVNKYHLWDCSVWEGRRAVYGPTDYTTAKWQVRLDDPGVKTDLQGDSADDLVNGVAITFVDPLTGRTERLTPDAYPELRDEAVESPANRHGMNVWAEFQISVPVLLASALQIGRAALAEMNAPKAPGSITTGPYVRDSAGKWQQAWKMRSGDLIAITSSSSLSDRPRLAHGVQYTHGPAGVGSATVAVDSGFKTLPAVLDRMSTGLDAAGLG